MQSFKQVIDIQTNYQLAHQILSLLHKQINQPIYHIYYNNWFIDIIMML